MEEDGSGKLIISALIFIFGAVVMLIVLYLSGVMSTTVENVGFTDTEVNEKVSNAVTPLNTRIMELEDIIKNLGATINETDGGVTITEPPSEKPKEAKGYLIDELRLETTYVDTFSDREIETLFDGEIEFENDNYEAEEILTLNGFRILANEKDFDGTDYLTIPEEGIFYNFIIEDKLNTSLIDDEDTLTIDFLGEMIEITAWTDKEVTFTEGSEYFLSEGEEVTIDGKLVVLEAVLEGSIYISVDNESKKIDEDQIKEVGGLEIKAVEVLYNAYADGIRKAVIQTGEDIERTVRDGDELSEITELDEDEIWEWVVNPNAIGLRLTEEFTELDEDYNALNISEALCLPKDYLCIEYNGPIEETFRSYNFAFDDDFIDISGNFISGINDYDSLLINSTGIYDDDEELLGMSVELEDTDLTLNVMPSGISVNDSGVLVMMNYSISGLWDDVSELTSIEDNYLTNYGIYIEDPEDSCDNQDIDLNIPEEEFEATISIY